MLRRVREDEARPSLHGPLYARSPSAILFRSSLFVAPKAVKTDLRARALDSGCSRRQCSGLRSLQLPDFVESGCGADYACARLQLRAGHR